MIEITPTTDNAADDENGPTQTRSVLTEDTVWMTHKTEENERSRSSVDFPACSVVTRETSKIMTGESSVTTQQRISDDYSIPEEIANEALLLLRDMNQPIPPDDDEENDEYALPVGTNKLPDIVSEMNEERGIKTIIDYDADIPEDMKLKPRNATTNTILEGKNDESDDTIIYDPKDFGIITENVRKPEKDSERRQESELKKSPKGQLKTQTYGIKKHRQKHKQTYTCIQCGTKRNSKQDINKHYRERHSSIKCPDCDRVFPTPDTLQ